MIVSVTFRTFELGYTRMDVDLMLLGVAQMNLSQHVSCGVTRISQMRTARNSCCTSSTDLSQKKEILAKQFTDLFTFPEIYRRLPPPLLTFKLMIGSLVRWLLEPGPGLLTPVVFHDSSVQLRGKKQRTTSFFFKQHVEKQSHQRIPC